MNCEVMVVREEEKMKALEERRGEERRGVVAHY